MWACLLIFTLLLCCIAATTAATTTTGVKLPLGDINIVSLTDTHSWVSGHGKHEDLDATYGHVLSFVERLKEMEPNKDIWFVMNGDFNDGTGLSQPVPSALTSILEQMPWDALTVGNHELYLDETFNHITQDGGFIQWFGKRYVTSNVVHTDSLNPLGHRYLILEGTNSRLLVFGFLYEMDYGSELKTVESVRDVLESDWFIEAMEKDRNAAQDVDAVLVLAHMGLEDELVHVLLKGIRNHVGHDMPIQFITGHTHNRGYTKLDNRSASFEGGRYLDTVGFVSFPKKTTFSAGENDFEHVFLDAKVSDLSDMLGLDSSEDLLTSDGEDLLEFIDRIRKHLGIDNVIGCSPRTFYLNSSLYAKDSLWALYKEEVVPRMFPVVEDEKKKVVIQNKHSTLRYSLFEGENSLDDAWAVNPFNESYYKVAVDVPGEIIRRLNQSLTAVHDDGYLAQLPDWIVIGLVEEEDTYDIYTGHFDVPALQEELKRFVRAIPTPFEPEPIDFGTTQIWIEFLKQEWPNCSTSLWHMEDDEFDLGRVHQRHHHERKKRGLIGICVSLAVTVIILAFLLSRNRRAVNEELTIQELLRLARERSNRYLDSIDFEVDDMEATKLT